MSFSYVASRLALAFIWLYHGLVPKLIFRHQTELDLVELGPTFHTPETTLLLAGTCEVVLGVLVLILWKQAWPIMLSIAGFAALMIGALWLLPEIAMHAFNPVTLSISAIAFGCINLSERHRITDARRKNQDHLAA